MSDYHYHSSGDYEYDSDRDHDYVNDSNSSINERLDTLFDMMYDLSRKMSELEDKLDYVQKVAERAH